MPTLMIDEGRHGSFVREDDEHPGAHFLASISNCLGDDDGDDDSIPAHFLVGRMISFINKMASFVRADDVWVVSDMAFPRGGGSEGAGIDRVCRVSAGYLWRMGDFGQAINVLLAGLPSAPLVF